jgi:hypothetical protein
MESNRLSDERMASIAKGFALTKTETEEIAAECIASREEVKRLARIIDGQAFQPGQAHDQAQSDSLTIGTLKEELREAREVAREAANVLGEMISGHHGDPDIYRYQLDLISRLRKLAGEDAK